MQCLAHTVPLIRVFLSEAYKADLNRDNPLGNKGELAEAFGDLITKMYQVNCWNPATNRTVMLIGTISPGGPRV